MPVSVIAGAQYGSEGKGKIAYEWALRKHALAAVRVGGSNSGHTVMPDGSDPVVFRQLPTAALIPGVVCVLPPGAYLDLDVLRAEIEAVAATSATLAIDPRAVVITPRNVEEEAKSGLKQRIGSTASGTGAAVASRVRRDGSVIRARDIDWLQPYLADTLPLLRGYADDGQIIIEGTQGYGLSLLHGLEGDYATSRDTTAAGFLSETGLSPVDVDEVVLVARAFPIRVAGNSGTLAAETTWQQVGARTGHEDLLEFTTVTKRVRRVGEFDPGIVIRSVAANRPTHLVLNHLDYVADLDSAEGRHEAAAFLDHVEAAVGRRIDLIGTSRSHTVARASVSSDA